MPSSYTPNYQLSQWEASDRVLRTDFNADNAKTDAAIKAVAAKTDTLSANKADVSALNALKTVVNGKGDCRIECGSYQGDGEAHRPITITASRPPKLIVVVGEVAAFIFPGTPKTFNIIGGGTYDMNLTWNGNSVTFLAHIYFNKVQTYHYVIFE